MDIIGIVALAVAAVAVGVPFTIDAVEKARLRIEPSEWRNPAFVPWTFATARVYNDPIRGPLGKLLPRQTAQACKAEIEYYEWDSTAPFLRLPGRWSSVPEPLSWVPSSLAEAPLPDSGLIMYTPVTHPVTGGTAPTMVASSPATAGAAGLPVTGGSAGFPPISGSSRRKHAGPEYTVVYDPARDPGLRDVAVSSDGEEIAVAILRDNEAFAFSTESYKHPSWGNPEWRLERGKVYRIVVRVRGSGVQREEPFRLEYLTTTQPPEFRLQKIR
jgi:hypothetical protein